MTKFSSNTAAITSAASVQTAVGKKVNFTVTTSGHPVATVTASGLPVWLTLSPGTGSKAGTAKLRGTGPAGGSAVIGQRKWDGHPLRPAHLRSQYSLGDGDGHLGCVLHHPEVGGRHQQLISATNAVGVPRPGRGRAGRHPGVPAPRSVGVRGQLSGPCALGTGTGVTG